MQSFILKVFNQLTLQINQMYFCSSLAFLNAATLYLNNKISGFRMLEALFSNLVVCKSLEFVRMSVFLFCDSRPEACGWLSAHN